MCRGVRAHVPFGKPGNYVVLSVTLVDGKPVAAPQRVQVVQPEHDKVPEVGEAAPEVESDTLTSAAGDVEAIDARRPTSDMHKDSFADVVGKKPVALLFATPQLCQSRVCGPVVDVALQLRARYGTRSTSATKRSTPTTRRRRDCASRCRSSISRPSPGRSSSGRTAGSSARLDGSFDLTAFEEALKTAL